MIRQENIVPPWKSIPLSTCPHPPPRCVEAVARSKFRTIVIPARDDDTELATSNGTAAFESFVLRLPVAIKRWRAKKRI